ncbi:MAG: hypothetical protein AAB459_02360 [Patescibacteria group bacterium]
MISVFGDLLTIAAKLENTHLELFSDGWVHKITKNGSNHFIYGYQFDLNDGVSQQLAADKCAAYELLNKSGLKAVPHCLVINWVQNKNGNWIRVNQDENHIKNVCQKFTKQYGLPLVTKPVNGTGGDLVSKAESSDELVIQIRKLLKSQNMAAVSPFLEASAEIRIYMLDNEVLLAYQKNRSTGDWRFNLGKGAKPEIISLVDETMILNTQNAFKSIGLRLGAVDFLIIKDGPIILEVNSGVMLNNFAARGLKQKDLAIQIYRKILQTMSRK